MPRDPGARQSVAESLKPAQACSPAGIVNDREAWQTAICSGLWTCSRPATGRRPTTSCRKTTLSNLGFVLAGAVGLAAVRRSASFVEGASTFLGSDRRARLVRSRQGGGEL